MTNLLKKTGRMAERAKWAPWFERYPERFAEEKASFEAKGFTLDLASLNNERIVKFLGRVGNSDRLLEVVFPGGFPSAHPLVIDRSEEPILPRHQRHDSRELCVFGIVGSRWSAKTDGIDVLEEVTALFQLYHSGSLTGEIDEEVHPPEPLTSTLLYAKDIGCLVPAPFSGMTTFPPGVEGDVKFVVRNEILQRFLMVELKIGGQTDKALPQFGQWSNAGKWGKFIFEPSIKHAGDIDRTVDNMRKKYRNWNDFLLLIAFPQEAGKASQQKLGWVLCAANRTAYSLVPCERYDLAERALRVPELAALKHKKIGFVGCGCLGSKIATYLAASGLGAAVLYDPDRMEAGNCVRHELGWPLFSTPKVPALGGRLREMNGEIGLAGNVHRVGGTNSAKHEEEIWNTLITCDLIVETTGVHSSCHYLNDFSFSTGIPIIFASVSNGAWAGEIVRVVPGRDACWLCWDHAFEDKRPPEELTTKGTFLPGCSNPTFTGSVHDIATTAGIACGVITDTLLRDVSNTHFRENFLLWRNRDESGKYDLKSERYAVPKRPNCSTCS